MSQKQEQDKKDLDKIRHSLSHLMAIAVQELMPEAQLAIGPTIDNGWYYDFLLPRTLIPEDLPLLEERVNELVRDELTFDRGSWSIKEALKWADENKQPFKRELIEDLQKLGETEVSYYETKQGDEVLFTDLCKGPHVANTTEIPDQSFKLTHISGAYWRGDENREQLQRIYGVAFATKAELNTYLEQQAEAAKRDHRKLGKELDLFTFSPLVGPGLALFTPRGTRIREALIDYITELQNRDPKFRFERVHIPHLAKKELYETSGHWDKFKDDLFHVKGKGNTEFVMKPMNCPHHTQIYASQPRSYRDLPLRYLETTMVYRDEQPGELNGLARVRGITQDDGHIFCTEEQIEAEVNNLYGIVQSFYETIGMALQPRLSLADPKEPKKYIGDRDLWDKAEAMLRSVLQKKKAEFVEQAGEAAFYGPKIDFVGTDALGREWQLATIQLDFNMPQRFKLEYIDKDGSAKHPIMIHRAILGSVERLMSVLIEHYGGRFPLWLAPEQVRIVPISEGQFEYAAQVRDEVQAAGLTVTLDDSSETMGKKIRLAETDKVPVTLVIGQREVDAKEVSVRYRSDLVDEQPKVAEKVGKVIEGLNKVVECRQLVV
ncbi:MAG: threonine--tRNA ligase [bacterium]|nr:threonine--tRNA ligase [bacterium]